MGFLCVEKKDKSLRPHIDCHGLDGILVKNCYPLTLMSSTFELLQEATVFTKLDLHNASHLVHIQEGDEWKTFNTPSRHYEYLVMLFSYAIQALINNVLRDLLNMCLFVYLVILLCI